MKREQLKPYQPLFCLMVFAILGLGYYQEHVGRIPAVDEFPFPKGDQLDLEELQVPGGASSLFGRVLDAEGKAAAAVQISLQLAQAEPGAAHPLHWTMSDAEGRYRLQGLEAEEYEVILYRAGIPISAGLGRISMPVSGEHDFTLAPSSPAVEAIPDIRRADLVGAVQLPAGRLKSEHPLAGYDVVARPLSANEAMTGAVTRRVSLDSSGLFTFNELVLGPYRLELLPPWGAGGSWPVVGALEWEHAADAGANDVILMLRAGAVTGVVLDVNSEPVQGAVVLLWPTDQPTRVWPMSQTAANGRVTIVDLPAGKYVVRVRAGSASSEVNVVVQAGITSGLTFDALDPNPKQAGE